jgi:hypothetical protein
VDEDQRRDLLRTAEDEVRRVSREHTLIVTLFSLIIYYWALRTKLAREEMLNLVNRQAAMPNQ